MLQMTLINMMMALMMLLLTVQVKMIRATMMTRGITGRARPAPHLARARPSNVQPVECAVQPLAVADLASPFLDDVPRNRLGLEAHFVPSGAYRLAGSHVPPDCRRRGDAPPVGGRSRLSAATSSAPRR